MPTIGAVIQARLNSSRLPGKMAKELLGVPLILRVVEQVSYSKKVDTVIVATSEEPGDDPLAQLCKDHGTDLYRGVLNDVQKRFINASEKYNLDVIIRITGDNPLTDPVLIDQLIELYLLNPDLDYINNVHRDGVVHGAGCELVTVPALRRSYKMIQAESDPSAYNEHVTFYIRKNPDKFNIKMFRPDEGLSRKEISFSVDYPEDFELVSTIYNNLYSKETPISTQEVLAFLDRNPSLLDLNRSLHEQLPDY